MVIAGAKLASDEKIKEYTDIVAKLEVEHEILHKTVERLRHTVKSRDNYIRELEKQVAEYRAIESARHNFRRINIHV